MPATRPYIPKIALVFDFDKTLASDSVDAIVGSLGLTRREWEERYSDPLGHGWDSILKRGHALIQAARDRSRPLTADVLREAAGRLDIYPGAPAMPDRLRATAKDVHDEITCEFVVLSSGFADIINQTEIAAAFDRVWAGTLHYEEGQAVAVKRIITHPEKARYLEALAKGFDIDGANEPDMAAEQVADREMDVPFDQMIYVGDGDSDLDAFGFLESRGGLAIAIGRDGTFDAEGEQREAQHVENVAPPTYADGSELLASLDLAVRACAARIALRAKGRGE